MKKKDEHRRRKMKKEKERKSRKMKKDQGLIPLIIMITRRITAKKTK